MLACELLAAVSEQVGLSVDGEDLVFYQAKPLSDPKGGDQFKGSNFIHPLRTPSGFAVTDLQPDDHKHHFGLWWPWKFIQAGERKILCWELQQGDGIIQAKEIERIKNGILAKSIYVDRKAPGGPVTRINETATITTSALMEGPATGYFLDIEITQEVHESVTVTPYRYSGFSIRCTPEWKNDNCTLLTSEGIQRIGSNMSRACWVRVEGNTGEGDEQAGLLIMSHPNNPDYPERLRTWEKGNVFVNFNTVSEKPWHFEPEESYTRQYRLFVYDGALSVNDVRKLWQQYSGQE